MTEGYELTEVENDIKHSLSIFPSEFGLDHVFNISVFSFFDKWVQAPLTRDNMLIAELLNEEPVADWVKTVIPRKIKIYAISKYLDIVDLAIKGITFQSKEKFYLNKSPKKLYKFISSILKPKNEIQEIQIERFINNCFNWDNSKYGSLRNHGNTITFLNRDNLKVFIGGLWYLINQKIINQISSNQFETIIIDELKPFNLDRIGLSKDSLRKLLPNYADLFKEKNPNLKRNSFK